MVNRLENVAPFSRLPGERPALLPTYSDAFGPAHVIGGQGALGGQHALLVLGLQVQAVRFRLLLQGRRGLLWQLRDGQSGRFWLIQPIQSSWLSLIKLFLGGEMQQVLKLQ